MKMKMNFRAALISVALVAGSIVPGAVYSGDLLKANGVSTINDAIDYYLTIDPNNDRYNQADFREFNGFNATGSNGPNEVVVVAGHKNVSDLGFWRRIEMVIDKRSGKAGNVAMTTYNFEVGPNDPNPNGLTKCCDPANAKSIVNMEYSPGPNGDRFTKFYIYKADGSRDYSTVFDPNPATAEELYLPNGCAACHGGGKNFRTRGGKTGGGFLAFDFNVFDYTGSNTTRAANEANVKKLNQGVLMTRPNDAVKWLLSGLYGGNKLPRATQNANWLPSDWATEPALWRVVVTDCQGCHTQSEIEVRNLDYWKDSARSIRELIFKEKTMPNAPYSNSIFWDTTHNNHLQTVNDALTRFGH